MAALTSYIRKLRFTDWSWWLLFLGLNFLLFLPRSFVSRVSFLEDITSRATFYRYFTWPFRRSSDDIFRLSVDLIIVLWVVVLAGKRLHRFRIAIFAGSYLLFLVYMIYDASFKGLYKFKPILANDLILFKYGFEIVWSDTPYLLIIGLAAMGVVSWGVVRVSRLLLSSFTALKIYRGKAFLAVSALCVLSFYKLHVHPLLFEDKEHLPIVEEAGLNFITFSIMRNITQSIDLHRKIGQFSIPNIKKKNDRLHDLRLRRKPNIYMVFVESYGRILYDHGLLKSKYASTLQHMEDRLTAHAVGVTSRFSISPVLGGGSWLAYTSMLYGTEINTQGLYQKLVNDESFHQVPNFLKWLSAQGYESVFLSPLATTKRVPDYDTYGRFYGVDKWVKPGTFGDYKGTRYGWGNIPPDQFIFNSSISDLRTSTKPHVIFFLTKNSHSPFKSPNRAVDDWRTLQVKNGPDRAALFSDKPNLEDYAQAIYYELDYLTRFAANMPEEDIMILIGDHQPPVLAGPEATSETMVHVLSKNMNFISSFEKYGFSQGMGCEDRQDQFEHKDLLWPLAQEIAASND